MDLALAHVAKQKLTAAGKEIDRVQLAALTYAARSAKERLLSDPDLASSPIALAARVAAHHRVAAHRHRQKVYAHTLDRRFFPVVQRTALDRSRAPRRPPHQLSLPYAQDAAVTRRLRRVPRQAGERSQRLQECCGPRRCSSTAA